MEWFELISRGGVGMLGEEGLDWRRGQAGSDCQEGAQTSASAEGHSRSRRLRKDPELRETTVVAPEAGGPEEVRPPPQGAGCLALGAPYSLSPPTTPLLSQGLQDECQYLLQPQLIVRRLLDVAVLVPGRPSEQTLSPHNRSALYK